MWPVSVSVSPRPTRWNNGSPITSSSSFSWPLIVGGVRCSSRVALTMLPSLATVQKYSKWL
jgi:hypothetical protein